MVSEISPKKVQDAVHRGAKRLHNFRTSRLMFIRNYVGQYYDAEQGEIGNEALNMIFNAVRILVPNIVMNHPKHRVQSKFLAGQEYAELLELALEQHSKQTNISDVYRRVIVDAIFTLGIMKTGLAESDSVVALGAEYGQYDVGEVYTEAVDFDNFVVDPASREHMFADASFIGDKICMPREVLLDSGLYRNDLVERLPKASERATRDIQASEISKRNIQTDEDHDLLDEVEVYEVWVPGANALVTVPASKDVSFDEYLRVEDYYGPDDGPYTLLSLTPPVPANPLPVPMVGVWNDLHVLGNRMAKKIIDQAQRQKDIVFYRRAQADDAEEAKEAGDGDAIASDDPDGIQVKSFGGQRRENEAHMAHLQSWFNQMAANPEAVGGQRLDADSATEARILAENANIGLQDATDLVYRAAAKEGRKRAWYFHTDPFIQVPLIRRQEVQQPPITAPNGVPIPGGTQVQEVQVFLTPEVRRGDWLDYNFEVEPESMQRKDSQTRFAEAMDFATKILPSAMQTAQTAFMLGLPFDVRTFILRMAKDRGIDWMDHVFFDPDFQMRMMMQMMSGPQPGQGQPTQQTQNPAVDRMRAGGRDRGPGNGRGGQDPLAAILQNGQLGQAGHGADPQRDIRRGEQQGANQAQRANRAGGRQAMY